MAMENVIVMRAWMPLMRRVLPVMLRVAMRLMLGVLALMRMLLVLLLTRGLDAAAGRDARRRGLGAAHEQGALLRLPPARVRLARRGKPCRDKQRQATAEVGRVHRLYRKRAGEAPG